MKSTEKIWHDENSEPPKNYIWAKNGKFFKYINGQWKEISKKAEESGGSGGGDSSSNDVFFVPATIQPKYFINEGSTELIEIKNYTPANYTIFFYNKEDIISLGAPEEVLNSLTQVTIDEAFDDSRSNSPTKGLLINKETFKNTIILSNIEKTANYSYISTYVFDTDMQYFLYKVSDDIFFILSHAELI